MRYERPLAGTILLRAVFGVIIIARLLHQRSATPSHPTPRKPTPGQPALMLWAWETPEDLRALDPSHAGVAYLSRELLVDTRAQLRLRHQPLLLPPDTYLAAVVRIETGPHFDPRTADVPALAQQILTAVTPSTRELQIDFDATASERDVYTALLRELRRRLPSNITLSITALVSWCGPHSWLHSLPVDEAVPMFFRMGGPAATGPTAARSQAAIAEPLCASSVGISTDEAWPAISPQQRVYIFNPGSWQRADLARVQRSGYVDLQHLTSIASPVTP